jgi:hypothetical protein
MTGPRKETLIERTTPLSPIQFNSNCYKILPQLSYTQHAMNKRIKKLMNVGLKKNALKEIDLKNFNHN